MTIRSIALFSALLALPACGGTWAGGGGSDTAPVGGDGGDGTDGADGTDGSDGSDGADGADGADGGGGGDACAAYVDAINGCLMDYYEALGMDGSDYLMDPETTCAGADSSYDSYFTCLADAYGGADCGDSSGEGYASAANDAASCSM